MKVIDDSIVCEICNNNIICKRNLCGSKLKGKIKCLKTLIYLWILEKNVDKR